jgi:hypothetical protein
MKDKTLKEILMMDPKDRRIMRLESLMLELLPYAWDSVKKLGGSKQDAVWREHLCTEAEIVLSLPDLDLGQLRKESRKKPR